MSFPAFPNLPVEIQAEIWREYILDANRNRLVPMDDVKKQILPTPSLTSPALRINFLARKTYLDMYPVQLPVFRTLMEPTFLSDDEDEDWEDAQSDDGISGAPCGCIYINFERDIFVIDKYERFNFSFEELGFNENRRSTIFAVTESLSPNQYGLIKHTSMTFSPLKYI
ncbi:hypothetical protein F5Y00DRAFT_233138 [Daldinia vernicosa]|uniref:uncharacterized protein n=1 Tax=Daldinia vernicosa TaxID=114800 RepID=UPI002008B0E9|nr:uncharacterized protein F5Y00DRAFT_233138 [Daldinia vernicosa]KAI0850350.1 hypothetical protein F5Y00DRAFT_233138 [Daldinia vernicosa]